MKAKEHVARNLGEAWKWGGCNPTFDEVSACVEKAMNAILEEAAKVCEGLFSSRSTSIENIVLGKAAAAIRALKETS
jgi:hypothetical protein